MGITSILVSLSPLILLPIISKSLGAANYGIWIQFNNTITLIPAIAALGLPYTMVRFLSASQNPEEIKETFYTIAFLVIMGCLFVAVLLLIFYQPIADVLFQGNFIVSLVLPVCIFIAGLILLSFDFFRTFNQMKSYSFFTFLNAYLIIIIVSFSLFLGYGITGAVFGFLIAQIIIFAAMYLLIISKIGFTLPKFHNIRAYLNFGLPTIPSNISFWILDITDRYLIGLLLGLSFVGYYSGGYLLGSIISILLSPFYTVLLPILSQYYAQNNVRRIKSLINHSIKFFLIMAIPSVFILTILSKPLLLLLSTPNMALNGYLITPIVAVGGLFFGLYGIISQIIFLERKTQITGNIWLISIVLNLVMDLTFGFYFGIIGIAVTTLLVYLFAFIVTLHYSFKFLRCNFYFGFISKTIVASILMSGLLVILNPIGPLNILFGVVLSFLVYVVLLWLLGGIRREELLLFKDILRDVLERLTRPILGFKNN